MGRYQSFVLIIYAVIVAELFSVDCCLALNGILVCVSFALLRPLIGW